MQHTYDEAALRQLPRKQLERLAKLNRERKEAAETIRFIEDLHPKQKAFVLDPARRKAALCSRRAGKSYGIAAWLLRGGYEDPHGLSLYVARSKNNARLILVDALEDLSRRYGLNLWIHEVDGQLMATLPNGHNIWLAGAKDSSEVGKFRGPKYKNVAIDEAQEYGAYLGEMVADAIQPALIDKRGGLVLAGTPGPVPAGLFYSATTGDFGGLPGQRWPTHSWTILDNTYIADPRAELADYRKQYGWTDDHPTYRREWLGQWVRDTAAIIYPFDATPAADGGPGRNVFRDLPEGAWSYGLGIDLGYEDSTAWVVAAFRRGHPEIYVVHAEKRTGLIPSAVAAHTERIQKQWGVSLTVADSGGFGKGYVEEMRKSYGLHIQPAEKRDKRAFQELVAGDLASGTIKLHPYDARALIDELQILQWNEDRTAEDERFENHAADAFLYICRALRPWYRPEQAEPQPGDPDYMQWAAAREKREAIRRANKRERRRDWRELV